MRVAGGRPLRPLVLAQRGPITRRMATAIVANLSKKIGQRELAVVRERLGFARDEVRCLDVESPGPGNVLLLEAEFADGHELVSEFGEKGVAAETVAERACAAWERWVAADVPVGEHLADQLLVPLALAGGGAFVTCPPTEHTRTNAALVARLLGIPIAIEPIADDQARVTVG